MILDNFRIVKVDKLNYRIQEFKKNIYKSYGRMVETEYKWIFILGYYPRLDLCLDALKEHLVGKMIDLPYVELKAKIEALNRAYVNCKIQVKEEK